MKITWNIDGFQEMRKDPALRDQINGLARDVATRAGNGFEWDSQEFPDRYRAIVFTDTPRAMRVNARDNTLLKALGGGK
ncbi:hypothetical protein [Corynebacterium auriscanis]|uniref:Uncharacterized protein n=1 Tax=Corynebacterium auriscanis TaxID=99807 RepID=A0A0A2DK45_9CORY|nr:hypothetical protein [Corynebacterium auriscanis]KGM18147.1 hypothetical protein MA47_09675 [Corynebacterium auriscanis]WJY73222.1 hypothetical protein CAURIC_08045 [Corynebacterium auriscanis]